jgi:hypothetical protein
MKTSLKFGLACLIFFVAQTIYPKYIFAIDSSKFIKDVENMIEKEKQIYKAMTEQNASLGIQLAKELDNTGKIVATQMIKAGFKEMAGPVAGGLLTLADGIVVGAKGLAGVAVGKLNQMKEAFVLSYIEARERGDSDEAAWGVAKYGLEPFFEGVKPKYNEAKVREYASEAYELKLKIQQDEKQLLFVEDYMKTKNDVINKPTPPQQIVINTSTQEAIKYVDLTYKIPFAKISPPELAKQLSEGKVNYDSSKYAQFVPPASLVKIDGIWPTGNWWSTIFAGVDGTLWANIEQAGDRISGTIEVTGSPLLNEGTIDGQIYSDKSFVIGAVNNLGQTVITYAGKVDSKTTMSGTYTAPSVDDQGGWNMAK